jgi:hypothetical protein
MTGTVTSTMTGTDVIGLRQAWTEHRFYKYRGCAPDVDDPTKAAGDPELSVDAWCPPDLDGGEDQTVRREREAAAVRVCKACPVLEKCRAYANSVSAEGRLVEEFGVLGGQRSLERLNAFVRHRHEVVAAAEDRQVRTPQKLAVLRALAAHRTPEAVAAAAGMDVRTANWQRSRLTTQLGLPAGASREALLEAAVARGLLEAPKPEARCRVPGLRRDRFTDVAGQLALWEAELSGPRSGPAGVPAVCAGIADVRPLFPSAPLEAAA